MTTTGRDCRVFKEGEMSVIILFMQVLKLDGFYQHERWDGNVSSRHYEGSIAWHTLTWYKLRSMICWRHEGSNTWGISMICIVGKWRRDKKEACQASGKVKTEMRVFFHSRTQEKPGMLDHKEVAFRNTTLLFHRLHLNYCSPKSRYFYLGCSYPYPLWISVTTYLC